MDTLWQFTKSTGLLPNDNLILYNISNKSMNVNSNINLYIKSFNLEINNVINLVLIKITDRFFMYSSPDKIYLYNS
jgi:hypothetical protein